MPLTCIVRCLLCHVVSKESKKDWEHLLQEQREAWRQLLLTQQRREQRLQQYDILSGDGGRHDEPIPPNDAGQRLIFKKSWLPTFKLGCVAAGELQWMDEPAEGWSDEVPANKWQWIYQDRWDMPWGLTFDGRHHPAWFRILQCYKHVIPREVPPNERDMIKQWVRSSLAGFKDLRRAIADLPDIESRLASAKEPQPENLGDLFRKIGLEKVLDAIFEGVQDKSFNKEVLKKMESELKVGELNEASRERTVRLDHTTFVNEKRYCSSWLRDSIFGKKRFQIMNGAQSSVRIEIDLKVKHVLPLMCCTKHVQVCTRLENLDLPWRSTLSLCGLGEESGALG